MTGSRSAAKKIQIRLLTAVFFLQLKLIGFPHVYILSPVPIVLGTFAWSFALMCKKTDNVLYPLHCISVIRGWYFICMMAGYQFMYGMAVHMMQKNTGCTVRFIHLSVPASNQYYRTFFLFWDGCFFSESGRTVIRLESASQ
ncbi:MAG: hypothetical protein ABS965_05030, partial [Succiniclasticum sp.]